ncbi:unnamed protein product [Musa textilis]
MEIPSSAMYVALVLVFTLLTALAGGRRRHKLNLPPGPRPWPVIGNLNLIGPLPHRSLAALSQKHGPLMQLRFGSFPVVVGSSVDMAKFFLKTHDLSFVSRPKTAAGKYTAYNFQHHLVGLRPLLAADTQDLHHGAVHPREAELLPIHPGGGGARPPPGPLQVRTDACPPQ